MSQGYTIQKTGDELVTDLLHLAEAINAAVTFQEVLEAVAPVLPDCSGVYLNLWEHLDYEKANYLQIAAAASIREPLAQQVGQRFMKSDYRFVSETRNDRIVVVEDVLTDPRIDTVSRKNYEKLGTHAYVRVTFQRDKRLIGMLFFKYNRPRDFAERERALALGVADLVLVAIERIQLQQETALANAQTHTLYQLAERTNAATSYEAIVETIAGLMPECDGVFLHFWENLDCKNASYFEIVAGSNVPDRLKPLIGQKYPRSRLPFTDHVYRNRITVIEDKTTDPRVDPVSSESWDEMGVKAVIWLSFRRDQRTIGGLFFNYSHPRQFTDREQQLAAGMGDLALAAVERIRLLRETADAVEAQRQAFEAEQEAREDLALLYKASEDVQAANTYQELVQAVAALTPQIEKVNLILWEHLDFQKAGYFEVVAGITQAGQSTPSIGLRYKAADFPITQHMLGLSHLAIEDINEHPLVDQVTRQGWQSDNVAALLLIRLLKDNHWHGVLSFESSAPYQFSQREQSLALAISDLVLGAVIRITTQQDLATAVEAQRGAYLAEQQAREEMAQLYQVSKAINQATNMSQVLVAAKQLFPDPVDVAIFAWEQYDRSCATYIESLASTDPKLKTGMRLPLDMALGATLLDSNDALVAIDVNGPEWADKPAVDSARFFGLHSIAYTNLVQARKIQGLFAIASYEAHTFSPQEVRLMMAITDLTAAALERFRSRQAEQEALQEREALFRASQGINAANSFQEVLEAVSHIDFDDGDHYLYIFENFDIRNASYIETVATHGQRFMSPGLRIPIDELPFLRTHPRPGLGVFENIPEHPELDEITKATLMSHGTLSNLRFGLSWHGRMLGSYGVDHAIPKQYSERDKRLLTILGELISAAVERIRLQGEMHAAKEHAEQLAEQAQQLAALEERTHLARELHDSVSQALYGIGLGAQTAHRYLETNSHLARESVDYILALAQAGLAEMRALIFELRPESLETEGLVVALVKQGASLQARHQIDVKLELGTEPSLPLSTKESLYRVLREALHNIIKHAKATQVTLRMKQIDSELWFEVIDNGVGFIVSDEFPGHLGLKSMRERIHQLGGTLKIDSAPGQGTCLTVKMMHI